MLHFSLPPQPIRNSFPAFLMATCLAMAIVVPLTVRSNIKTEIAPSPSSLEKLLHMASYQAEDADPFVGGIEWINTARPIALKDLRGKIVLLDFWTYCCINCHNVIPDLEKLEEKYKDELVVIGVHSPKFEAERDTENIRKKVHEYQIKHPVVNDANMSIWREFNARSWPTLAVIDANGRFRGSVSGEGHYDTLDEYIGKLAEEHRAKGELNETPFVIYAESDRPSDGPLLFPGKVLADQENNRLFIADTSHHRLVVTDLDGQGLFTIGNGERGLKDGNFEEANFHRPQGMCLVENVLYVADTENNAIRKVNLEAKTVETAAGTGEQSYRREGSAPAKEIGLNAPWDVIQIPGTNDLVIAMAGPHQLWRFDLDRDVVEVWAGSGREDIIDGTYQSAAFAQPSGLATDGDWIFVADSEVSGLRAVAIDPKQNPQVRTIVGLGLFDFGDQDGRGAEVRLQHCLGLAFGEGTLYVADTYNNKIKAVNPKDRTVRTLLGTKEPGSSDTVPNFYQPGGLSLAGSTLYVADTNNHAVRAINLETQETRTLSLEGIGPPIPPARKPSFARATEIQTPVSQVLPGDQFEIELTVDIPGFKIVPENPVLYLVESPDKPDLLGSDVSPTGSRVIPEGSSLNIPVSLAKPAKSSDSLNLKISTSIFVCSDEGGFCTLKNFSWTLPVIFSEGADSKIKVSTAVDAQKTP